MATYTGTDANNIINGTSGDDTLLGQGGDDTLRGRAGNDIIDGGAGDDRLLGEAGDDTIYGGDGADEIEAGDGNDTVSGDQGDDGILGGEGDDIVDAGAGADFLEGGLGNDTLTGGAGADLIAGGELTLPADTTDLYDPAEDADTASYAGSAVGVMIDLANRQTIEGSWAGFAGGAMVTVADAVIGAGGDAEGDVLVGIENLEGSAYDDVLGGDDGVNTLSGGDGNDTLRGGAGDDVLSGGGGADIMDGGDGYDIGDWSIATTNATFDLAQGTSSGNDVLISIEGVIGGSGNDTIIGNDRDNLLDGRSGNDTLLGGEGDDVMIGGTGRDIMTGGDGADRFVFQSLSDSGTALASRDRIMDLDIAAGDRIDFSTLDIDPSTTAREGLTFIGTGAYSGTVGEMRITASSNPGYTAITIDGDGDRISDFIIEVTLPLADFTADAFLL